jgi:RIO kinase 1
VSASVDWDALTYHAVDERLEANQRWSTWDDVDHTRARGPQPWPDWLVTARGALDTDLGVLKTGKEADVFLLERGVPDGPSCLLAAKRYRTAKNRLFHRDSGYTEGRTGRDSRENRAVNRKSAFGRAIEAGRWADAEFATLKALWSAGVRVPYPVQIDGLEILMEYIDDGEVAAPRLAQTAPTPDQLDELWRQVVDAMTGIASLQYVHGDLSPYNVLVRGLSGTRPEVVVIDVPQVVDLVANPSGVDYLHRDCRVMATWFTRRGHPVDADALLAHLLGCAW